jgi:hypothetical protein
MSIASEPQKRVFISYARASDEHKLWIKKVPESLRSQSITVTLDQDDLRLGYLWKFEKDGISLADRVLVICSKTYLVSAGLFQSLERGKKKRLLVWS